jgi:hypothetical protein
MERELWTMLAFLAKKLDHFRWRGLFTTADIVVVYFWAVIHDRPTTWAVNPANWPPDLRPWLPSQSTMSRRLRTPEVPQLLQLVEESFSSLQSVTCQWLRIIDGKPLSIGGNSKDGDARFGRGAGSLQKGYKLHAIWGSGPLPIAWGLAHMAVSEKTMARQLIPTLPSGGYLLGDSEYDCTPLYDLAAKAGYQLVAEKRWRGRTGLGHRPQSPHRLRSIELLKRPFGRALYQVRSAIERCFGNCTSFAGGMAPLPAWVRRFPRVRNWLHAKLLVNAARFSRNRWPEILANA